MLCRYCHSFIDDILNQDYQRWSRKPKHSDSEFRDRDWLSIRHGNHHDLQRHASKGCEVCALMVTARARLMPEKLTLAEKWKLQAGAIDVDLAGQTAGFWLYLAGPSRSRIYFDIFNPVAIPYGLPSTGSNGLSADGLQKDTGRLMGPIAQDPMAFHRFNLARSWIVACYEQHSRCQRNVKTPLPTRVIDVGPSDGSEEPRLYVSPGHSRSRDYVVLTHCWGQSERLVTTHKNLKKHQRAIPMSDLPATIRDAITIVRMIGEKYLWVDCLCIVQDSRRDWDDEAVKMCDIYQNSLFCLSALDSQNSSTGILKKADTEHATFTVDHGDPPRLGVRIAPPTFAQAIALSPLTQRAWCLQERMLAPAILHFSQSQMFWECAEGECSESQPTLRPSSGGPKNLLSTKIDAFEHKDRKQIQCTTDTFAEWYEVVETYSSKRLTFERDRLPAILGLARKFAALDKTLDHYIFGIWEEDIHRGLLWRTVTATERSSRALTNSSTPTSTPSSRASSRASSTTSSRRSSRADSLALPLQVSPKSRRQSSPYRGERPNDIPSWSWASISGKVTWSYYSKSTAQVGRLLLTALDPDISTPSTARRRSNRSDPGDYVLLITGRLKRGSYKEGDGSTATGTVTGTFKANPRYPLKCRLDDPDFIVNSCYCLRVASWSFEHRQERMSVKSVHKALYLILDRHPVMDDSNMLAYRRIGIGDDNADSVERVFRNTEKSLIALY